MINQIRAALYITHSHSHSHSHSLAQIHAQMCAEPGSVTISIAKLQIVLYSIQNRAEAAVQYSRFAAEYCC